MPAPYAKPLSAGAGDPDVSEKVIAALMVRVREASVSVCAGVDALAVSATEIFRLEQAQFTIDADVQL